MPEQDGDAEPSDLRGMDPVAAYLRHRFNYRRHFDSRLRELVADYKADVACPDHNDFFARYDAVYVHKRLDRAGSVYAGKVVVRERDHSFRRACRYDRFLRLDAPVLIFSLHYGEYAVFRVAAGHCRVAADLHFVLESRYLVKQYVSYLIAAGTRILVF